MVFVIYENDIDRLLALKPLFDDIRLILMLSDNDIIKQGREI